MADRTFLCEIVLTRNVNHCTVWNDSTGHAEEEGDYRLLRENRPATREELQFRWANRSGQIGLKDNKELRQVATRHLR
jgi:hypothetical protein